MKTFLRVIVILRNSVHVNWDSRQKADESDSNYLCTNVFEGAQEDGQLHKNEISPLNENVKTLTYYTKS